MTIPEVWANIRRIGDETGQHPKVELTIDIDGRTVRTIVEDMGDNFSTGVNVGELIRAANGGGD